jgi:hypothetical protein
MAVSLDLAATARLLLDVGLAHSENCIVLSPELRKLDRVADIATLKGIARILLIYRPPDWLRSVVIDGKVAMEFIPQNDREAISWLSDDLEAIILAAYGELYEADNNAFLRRLGNAGELAVMSALRRQGLEPRHVSPISDRFGYDIELDEGARRHGLEVKTAVSSTSTRIFVSRNEFEVAKRMGDHWKIIQVIFSSSIIASGRAFPADVEVMRELSSASLLDIAPLEGDFFRWTDTAEFKPPQWSPSNLVIAQDFAVSLDEI